MEEAVTRRNGEAIVGKFTAICIQCRATVGWRAPAYFRYETGGTRYSRLILLPWGNGHIEML